VRLIRNKEHETGIFTTAITDLRSQPTLLLCNIYIYIYTHTHTHAHTHKIHATAGITSYEV